MISFKMRGKYYNLIEFQLYNRFDFTDPPSETLLILLRLTALESRAEAVFYNNPSLNTKTRKVKSWSTFQGIVIGNLPDVL